jgi:glycosyltransferase involved in cell wall biosynthesis
MRVLALCSYPVEAAATRFRLVQFIESLRKRGIELTVSPFLSSDQFATIYTSGGLASKAMRMAPPLLSRLTGLVTARKYDVLLVQREAMLFGPGIFERLYSVLGQLPMVLDLDDATYVRYVSPTYGRTGSSLKFFGKTDNLIRLASAVTCGNRFIAEHVEGLGAKAVVLPTVVNLDEYRPQEIGSENETVTLGWVGTHSTFPFLQSLFPVFKRLAEKHKFRLKIVGAGRRIQTIDGVEIDYRDWSLEREVDDFRSLDIGLYPITVSASANPEWIKGKSGFKAVQYMAVGIPFVMSPVGVCAEMGEPGSTHFNAVREEDWYTYLNQLLSDRDMRLRMGSAGRNYALSNYQVEQQAEVLAQTLKSSVLSNSKR